MPNAIRVSRQVRVVVVVVAVVVVLIARSRQSRGVVIALQGNIDRHRQPNLIHKVHSLSHFLGSSSCIDSRTSF